MKSSRTSRGVAGIFYCRYPVTPLYIATILLIGALLSVPPLCAQEIRTITGNVYDAVDGSPVAGALVSLENTEYNASTNESGMCTLSAIPAGEYRIRATAEGFDPSAWKPITIHPGIDAEVTIRLNRKIYFLGESHVRAEAAHLKRSEVAVVTREEIEKQASTTVSDVLDNIEGVFVQASGPSGSESRVSIRGCDPRHVLVLIDGQRINAAGTGVADLSSIPLDIIDRIEVYKGGESARFGSDALAGVIAIKTVTGGTYSPDITLMRNWTDWNGQRIELTARDLIPAKKFSHRVSISHFSTDGDFPYDYSVSPRPDLVKFQAGDRRNAAVEQSSYYGSGRYEFNASTTLSLSGQVYRSTNGMPGPVSDTATTDRKEDNRLQANAKLETEYAPFWTQTASIGFSRFEQYFNNAGDPLPASRFESRYINDIGRAEIMQNIIPFSGHDITAGVSFERNILYHDDLLRSVVSLGRTVRNNIGMFVSDRQTVQVNRPWLPDAVTISGSVRSDNTDTKRDGAGNPQEIRHDENGSHKITLSMVKGTDTKFIIRTGYGQSFRLPEVNALFWKGDVRSAGNPDLLPEKAEHSDIGIEFHITHPVSLSMGTTYFHQYTKNLIVWQPTSPGQTWKPVNLDASRVTGHEDFIELHLFADILELSYQNMVTVPKNRTPGGTSYNKDLTFRPRYITTWSAALQYRNLFCEYSLRSVGRRYALAANTKWYDAYTVSDVAAGFTLSFSDINARLTCRLNNFENENYVLIAQYPMPGREWDVRVSLSYRPQLKKQHHTIHSE